MKNVIELNAKEIEKVVGGFLGLSTAYLTGSHTAMNLHVPSKTMSTGGGGGGGLNPGKAHG